MLFAGLAAQVYFYTARMKHLVLALVLVVPLAALAATVSHPPLAPVDGEVIVGFKSDANVMRMHTLSARAGAVTVSSVLAQRAATLGARVGRTLQAGAAVSDRAQVVRSSGMTAQALAAKLASDPDVAFAVPNGRLRRTSAPNDPLYAAVAAGVRPNGPDSGQWYLRAPAGAVASSIDVETAWTYTTGSASVVVAVLDTGVRPEHPDLSGRLLPGYDFVSDVAVANDGSGRDADATDPGDWVTTVDARDPTFSGCTAENSSWHGTSTASLVGASTNDGIGMAGTAPGVKILPVRVLGKCFGSDADIQAGMLWAAGISVPGVPDNPNPARVLNMSLGGSGACNASYQNVVDRIRAKGAVIVAAAGNSAGGAVGTPGNCQGVIAVLALRHAGTKVGFSDLGSNITIAAPGGNCINTGVNEPCLYPIIAATNTGPQGPIDSGWTDSYNASVGTSFSAPLVAATAGLMFSQQPQLTPEQISTQLQATARAFPTTGGDNGDGSVVPACHAPTTGVDQLQCYCNTTYCGAGMLNAGAAVASVSGPVARIVLITATPTAGSPVQLSGATSVAAGNSTITGYDWTLTNGGGIVTGFSSATNASTVTLIPSAAGSFTLTLAATDGQGRTGLAIQTVTVAAAPAPTAPSPGGGSGGGGGAMTLPWLALLALAVAALFKAAPARRV